MSKFLTVKKKGLFFLQIIRNYAKNKGKISTSKQRIDGRRSKSATDLETGKKHGVFE